MKSRTEWITWCCILAANVTLAIAGAIYWTWFEEGELLVTVICWICIPALTWALWYELGYPAREGDRQLHEAEMFKNTLRGLGVDVRCNTCGEDFMSHPHETCYTWEPRR